MLRSQAKCSLEIWGLFVCDLEIVAGMEHPVSATGPEQNTAELEDAAICALPFFSFFSFAERVN